MRRPRPSAISLALWSECKEARLASRTVTPSRISWTKIWRTFLMPMPAAAQPREGWTRRSHPAKGGESPTELSHPGINSPRMIPPELDGNLRNPSR